jgi:hypothetical protein
MHRYHKKSQLEPIVTGRLGNSAARGYYLPRPAWFPEGAIFLKKNYKNT